MRQEGIDKLFHVEGLVNEPRFKYKVGQDRHILYNRTQEQCNSSQGSRSHDSSLNSMFEVKVDQLYDLNVYNILRYLQSKQMQRKLKEGGEGFGKTVKMIQRNEQIKQDAIQKCLTKITGPKNR